MPNIKSAIRRVKTAKRNNLLNTVYKTKMKKAIKAYKTAKDDKSLRSAVSIIDKCSLKRVISKNKGARLKSQLMKKPKA